MNDAKHRWLRIAGLCCLLAGAVAMPCLANDERDPPHKGQDGSDVEVHYVLLKGMAGENISRETVKQAAELCKAIGRSVPRAPETLSRRENHVYYARQASIVYERSWRYQVDPKCGEGHWAFTQRAILQTPKGSCSIDFALRRAQSATPGGCHPEEYLGATAEVLPPSDTGEQFLGTQVYAGRTCKAFRSNQGGLLGDRCTYAPKGFSPYQADMGWSRPAGVNLLIHIYADGQEKPEDAIPYLAAQEVQEAIRVSRGVFLPHIAGGFRIMETGVK